MIVQLYLTFQCLWRETSSDLTATWIHLLSVAKPITFLAMPLDCIPNQIKGSSTRLSNPEKVIHAKWAININHIWNCSSWSLEPGHYGNPHKMVLMLNWASIIPWFMGTWIVAHHVSRSYQYKERQQQKKNVPEARSFSPLFSPQRQSQNLHVDVGKASTRALP